MTLYVRLKWILNLSVYLLQPHLQTTYKRDKFWRYRSYLYQCLVYTPYPTPRSARIRRMSTWSRVMANNITTLWVWRYRASPLGSNGPAKAQREPGVVSQLLAPWARIYWSPRPLPSPINTQPSPSGVYLQHGLPQEDPPSLSCQTTRNLPYRHQENAQNCYPPSAVVPFLTAHPTPPLLKSG